MIEPGLRNKSGRCRAGAAASCAALVAINGILSMATVQAAELTPRDMACWIGLPGASTRRARRICRRSAPSAGLPNNCIRPPKVALPEAARAQIEAMPDVHKFPFDIAMAFEQQAKTANQVADPDQKKAAQQVYQQAMNDRAKQAAARSHPARALCAGSVARAHDLVLVQPFQRASVQGQHSHPGRRLRGPRHPALALGKFRDLLVATLHHPAMLRYLDNADNAAGHLNENYAREIMELHTMGVGSGYTQADVEALARILTGVGIDLKPEDPKLKPELQSQLVREGAFEFNPARHDYGDKMFLGHTDQGARACRSRRGDRYSGPPSGDGDASVPADRDLFRLRQSAGCAGAADGADLQVDRRRYRRGACRPWCMRRNSPPR